MKNQACFDLNKAIAEWRAEMAARESIGSDRLRELESHLNDAMAGFRSKGLGDEDAFYLAKRKMGESAEVAAEFEKENPAAVWKTRAYWILIGFLSAHFLGQIRTIVANTGAFIAA